MGALINEPVIAGFDVFPGQFQQSDWQEAVALFGPGQYTITRKKSYCTLTGYVPWSKFMAAQQYFLGYSFVEQTSGQNSLARALPAFHPILTWLYATTITEMTGVKFDGKEQNIIGQFDVADPDVGPRVLANAKYKKVRMTVAYEMAPYLIEFDYYRQNGDVYPVPEWTRYTNINPSPYVQQISYPAGSYLYDAPTEGWDNQAIASNFTLTRLKMQGLKLVWYEVPYNFVCDPNNIAVKLLAMEKTVNEFDFMGYTPMTLYCDKTSIDKYTAPLASQIANNQMWMCDITMDFTFFDPEPAPTYGGDLRGHNLVPGVNGLYYGAVNRANSEPIYPSSDFNDAFTYWNS